MPVKKEITLLPESENANSLVNRLLRWITTVGRVVIIVTEFIVIGAFLSRFWLDRKNSDLSEVIRQQKAILETTQSFEKDYNLLQQRLKYISDHQSVQSSKFDVQINAVVNSIPTNIGLETLSRKLESNISTLTLTCISYDETAIVDLITNLSLNPSITKLDIQKIEKKSKDNKYYINLTMVLK